jgi:hypothetical protein
MSELEHPQLKPSRAPTQGIEKIAQLVARRQNGSLEEIARIIDNDSAVTGKLMARAYPRAPAREGATVQMATSRVGINYVIVLYITELLTQYVIETFQTQASIALTKDDPALMPLEERSFLVASVKFKGKATGKISLVFSSSMSLLVADRLLGEGVEMNLETMHAAIADIATSIAVSLQAGLCDGRLTCTVEPPEVSIEEFFPEDRVPGGSNEEFYFRHGSHGLRVHLSVSPFSL